MPLTESSHSPAKNRKTRVMAFGTFDLFHPGHVYYLTEAEKLGDELIVVIARDARVLSIKGRSPVHDELRRRENVAHAFPHAQVILGDSDNILKPIQDMSPDVLVFGYDQRVDEEKLREHFPALAMIRIGGYETEKWKSSLLREGYDDNQ